jgi:uncharacterized protein (TIGR00730 family)
MVGIKSICVYCGSSVGNDPDFANAATRLGRAMAEAGLGLVYGGGNIGLMGAVADAALEAGGRVVGVIPEDLKAVELAHGALSELVVVSSMHERKREMFERADAFVILPGGLGTLDEAFEMITWAQLRLHGKPVVIVNERGYWAPLIALIEHAIDNGFARNDVRDLFAVADRVDDVLPILQGLPTPRLPDRPEKL